MSSSPLGTWKNLKTDQSGYTFSLLHKAQLQALWRVLPEARLVGGVVRDLLAGHTIHDIDLAIPVPPEDVYKRLKETGFPVIPTGLKHGTLTAVVDKMPFEITTLRKDVRTDGRHAQVVWTDCWQEDALRRDFTINAMFLDKEGVLYDYFDGQQDLHNKIVRFVGNPVQRIEEDSLRILRFFRFHARYGGMEPDREALAAITHKKNLLDHLSAERIWSELKRIFIGPQVSFVLELMAQSGVLSTLFPQGYNVIAVQALVSFSSSHNPLVLLYALTSADPAYLAQKLRLSGQEKKVLQALQATPDILQPDMGDKALRQILYKFSSENVWLQSFIAQLHQTYTYKNSEILKWKSLRIRIKQMHIPVFPLHGKDLLEENIPPGKKMGALLKETELWWWKDGCIADKSACLHYVRQQMR